MSTLVLTEVGGDARHVVRVRRVLVAGFTGRDAEAVAVHMEELSRMGVSVPESTPTFYRLGSDAVRQTSVLVVSGQNTSGEVEPVVVASQEGFLLTVGSDHTDRELESEDIALGKEACGKVIGSVCVRTSALDDWDGVRLESEIEGELYQQGTLGSLLSLDEVLGHLRDQEGIALEEGDVLFLGTIPVRGEVRPSSSFSAKLILPGFEEEISLSYRVVDISSTGRHPFGKPELEFFDVEGVEWTPVEGGMADQAERILSFDPQSGLTTRVLRFQPGADTTPLGVLRHDFWEEVFILSGELHDLTLDEVFGPGTYACRPPGMPHGPWRSSSGCLTFEVRYPAI